LGQGAKEGLDREMEGQGLNGTEERTVPLQRRSAQPIAGSSYFFSKEANHPSFLLKLTLHKSKIISLNIAHEDTRACNF
jgi:hypothetical protein